jgi:hypothetical protein
MELYAEGHFNSRGTELAIFTEFSGKVGETFPIGAQRVTCKPHVRLL